ncbi:MAG: universal stress protein [Desulfosalsimonas sp.]
MNIRKILWPTDFSSRAEAALPYVQSLSRQYGAETHVLHVIEDISHHEGWYGEFGKDHIERLKEQLKERASKRLDQICRDHLEGCPLFIRHVAVGDPAREILDFIERQQVDAVIMATKGNKNSSFFGSVAERVIKNSPVAVTTIPSG